MKNPYDDIIELPHHVSCVHPQMSMEERAAQFSPFAALTGYGAVIQETARLTVPRLELSESSQEEIKRKLDDLRSTSMSGRKQPSLITGRTRKRQEELMSQRRRCPAHRPCGRCPPDGGWTPDPDSRYFGCE